MVMKKKIIATVWTIGLIVCLAFVVVVFKKNNGFSELLKQTTETKTEGMTETPQKTETFTGQVIDIFDQQQPRVIAVNIGYETGKDNTQPFTIEPTECVFKKGGKESKDISMLKKGDIVTMTCIDDGTGVKVALVVAVNE